MQTYAFILANITDCMDHAPELAMSVASKNMDWLFGHDIPGLNTMLLTELPVLRKDHGMMRGYMFLMDFLEVVSEQTSSMILGNQRLMRSLFEAAKVSETYADEFIHKNADKLTSPEFLVFLDSEISHHAANGNELFERMLVTMRMRLLEEKGRSLGVDVQVLPKLAALDDLGEMKRKTLAHIAMYDTAGKELFLQTIHIMMDEMKKRYTQVDPLMIANLQEVAKIVRAQINTST